MKIWELWSILREDTRPIIRAAATRKAWARYGKAPDVQDRAALDEELPDDFVRNALKRSGLKFFLSRDGKLASRKKSFWDRSVSVLAAFERFGGRALEEALEYGSVKVG